MGKFDIADPRRKHESFYTGAEQLTPSLEEVQLMQKIRTGSMQEKGAKQILTGMDPNAPMKSREEFASLIAALVAIYPQRMDVRTHLPSRSHFDCKAGCIRIPGIGSVLLKRSSPECGTPC